MIRNGANGYLPKDTSAGELYKALTDIANSGYYHSGILPNYFHKMGDVPSLNSMERQFLSLCCRELTYKQIGQHMNISSRTVESYREHLFEKLNVTTRTGLVMFAVKTGLV
jgi:DNA-binding NarL/FixJ family response regulator